MLEAIYSFARFFVMFRHPKSLKKHRENHSKTFACEICGKRFARGELLKNHFVNLHTPDDQKPYQCHYCKKGFAKASGLETHINLHTNAKPFKCQYCGTGFNALANR